jgi:hypothetical protein
LTELPNFYGINGMIAEEAAQNKGARRYLGQPDSIGLFPFRPFG